MHKWRSVTLEMFAGQLMAGFSASFTVMVKLHTAMLLLASVTFQFTMVVPFGKVEPLAVLAALVRVRKAPGQLSENVGFAYVVTALHWPGSVLRVMFVGHTMLGFSRSLTVTVNTQVGAPQVLVVVTVTVVLPLLKFEPLPVQLPLPVVAQVKA